MRSRRVATAVAAVLLGALPAYPRGGEVAPLFEELVRRSDLVLLGQSTRLPEFAPCETESGPAAYEQYAIAIERVLAGEHDAGEPLVVLVRGGAYFDEQRDRFVITEPDLRRPFDPYRRTLLLLKRAGDGRYTLTDPRRGQWIFGRSRSHSPVMLIATDRGDLLDDSARPPSLPVPRGPGTAYQLTAEQVSAFVENLAAENAAKPRAAEDRTVAYCRGSVEAWDLDRLRQHFAQIARAYITARVGAHFMSEHIVTSPVVFEPNERCTGASRSCAIKEPYFQARARIRVGDLPFEGGISLAISLGGEVLPGSVHGVPDCARDPGECHFPFNEQQARQLARDAGTEPGIAKWETWLQWNQDHATWIWRVVSESAPNRGRTMVIDANSGEILQDFEWMRDSHSH